MGARKQPGVRMGRSKRSSPQGVEQTEHWLGDGHASRRSRPWAYEELLLGPTTAEEGASELEALAADLAGDLVELRRMQGELHDQVVRIAALQGRIETLHNAVGRGGGHNDASVEIDDARTRPPALPHSSELGPSLARCEGFQVECAEGVLGYVEGLRFVSRIDQPDLLEVRGGRFGRELVLIPAEAVDEVVPDEERILVRGAPAGLLDPHPHELVRLLRRALHHEP